MSWRDKLLDASFKGVSFKVRSATSSGGRRTRIHQYANREEPYVQDVGKEADGYNIEGYIVSNLNNFYNYFGERDALINVLKSKGAGTLIHPFLGIKRVILTSPYGLTETFNEGGIARFTMSFTEAGVRALPKKFLDFLTKMDNTVNRAFDYVGDYFYSGYKTYQSFMSVSSSAINRAIELNQVGVASIKNVSTKVIDQTLQNINAVKSVISSYVNLPNDLYNGLKDVSSSFAIVCGMGTQIKNEAKNTRGTTKAGTNEDATESRASDVFIDKLTIEDDVIGGETGEYSGITRGDTTKLSGSEVPADMGQSVLKSINDQVSDFDITPYTITPASQQSNVSLIFSIFKLALLGYATRIAVRTDFQSQEKANEYKELLTDTMDDFLNDLGTEAAEGPYSLGIGLTATDPIDNNVLFTAIKDIRNIFVEGMNLKSVGLAKELNYKVEADVISCLELAYEKYEDANRYEEIYSNNKSLSSHPGFLPSGDTITILSA